MYEKVKARDHHIPSVGLGLWKIDGADATSIVEKAIEIGYRHIDSAADYGNEKETGYGINAAIKKGYCNRHDLWVTSKLWNNYHRPEHVRPACEKTLKDLGLDYLDLYLIHFPISLKFVPFDHHYPPGWNSVLNNKKIPKMEIDPVPLHMTWLAMEKLVDSGLVKSIGVCNYNTGLLHDLMAYSNIQPAMLQIESHPYLAQENLVKLAMEYNLAVTAFSPLASLSYVSLDMARPDDSIINKDVIKKIANEHGKTPAQIVLRWGLQRGTAIIPKTIRFDRLKENISIFDFSLSSSQMSSISALNCNRRYNDPATFCKQSFGKFFPIYQ